MLLGYGQEFYAFYLWNSLGFFTISIAAHILVNGLLYDASSVTGGYFMTNVQELVVMADLDSAEICWRVHAASLCALLACLGQVCAVFLAQSVLFKTKYKFDECVSLSFFEENQSF